MGEQIDGGPAFPETIAITPSGDVYPGYHGMTLRDWFAGQALAGMVARECDAAPVYAYFLADAMLAERAKATGGETP